MRPFGANNARDARVSHLDVHRVVANVGIKELRLYSAWVRRGSTG